MLTPAIRLREKLATNAPVVGVMATDHVWPLLVELCKQVSPETIKSRDLQQFQP